MTIFDKIIAKEIPAKIVYEDELCLAFHDVQPQAPVHVLLIPKIRIRSMADVEKQHKEVLGHLMLKASEIAHTLGIANEGFRIVANSNLNGGQSVFHLHFHIMGGRPMLWPPG